MPSQPPECWTGQWCLALTSEGIPPPLGFDGLFKLHEYHSLIKLVWDPVSDTNVPIIILRAYLEMQNTFSQLSF